MNSEQLWLDILNRMEERISKPSYETWLKHTKAKEIKDTKLIVEVKNEFQRDWLISQYTGQIEGILNELTGENMEIIFEVGNETIPVNFTQDQRNHVTVGDLLRKIEKLEERVSELEDKVKS